VVQPARLLASFEHSCSRHDLARERLTSERAAATSIWNGLGSLVDSKPLRFTICLSVKYTLLICPFVDMPADTCRDFTGSPASNHPVHSSPWLTLLAYRAAVAIAGSGEPARA